MSKDFDVVKHCNRLEPKLQPFCQHYTKKCVEQRDEAEDKYTLGSVSDGAKTLIANFENCIKHSPNFACEYDNSYGPCREFGTTLPGDTTFHIDNQAVRAMGGTSVYFSTDDVGEDSVDALVLAEDTTFHVGNRKIRAMKGKKIFFDPDGKVFQAVLAEDALLNAGKLEVWAMKGTEVQFRAGGNVRFLTLGKELTFHASERLKLRAAKGSFINFDWPGRGQTYVVLSKGSSAHVGDKEIRFEEKKSFACPYFEPYK